MSDYSAHFVVRGEDVSKPARDYLSGLLGTERRKNVERIHGGIPESNYQSIQQFITDSPWNHDALMEQVARDANGMLGGHPRSCPILDETTFIKKGAKTSFEEANGTRNWLGLRIGGTGCAWASAASYDLQFSLVLRARK